MAPISNYINASNFATFNTHQTSADGGSYETDTTAGSFHDTGFLPGDKWFNTVPFVASQTPGLAAAFYQINTVTGNGQTAIGAVGAKRYAGTFSFDAAAGTLTYQTAPIPEPSTYALMAAGMVLVGGLARRRRSKG
jgi:hypothetical protein